MFHGIYADPAEAVVVCRLTFGVGHDFEMVVDHKDYDESEGFVPLENRLFPLGSWSAPFNLTGKGRELGDTFPALFTRNFAATDLGRTMIDHLGKIEMLTISVRSPLP